MVLAGLASGVDAVFEDGGVAFGSFGARRCKTRFVAVDRLDALDEPVPEIVGKVEFRTVGDVPSLVGQFRVTFGEHAFSVAVVGDAIGLENAPLVVKLRVADRRYGVL